MSGNKAMRWALATGAALVALAALTELANARPGGGHSYSGGGGGGSGGGGDGEGVAVLVHLLIRLIFYYPQVGLPLAAIVVVGFIIVKRRDEVDHSWDSTTAFTPKVPARVDRIKAIDPMFSEVVFNDFCFALFARAHRARHDQHALAQLAPYLTADVRHGLAGVDPVGDPVVAVAVGAMRITRVVMPDSANDDHGNEHTQVTVVFEANVTTQGSRSGNRGQALAYVTESWVFRRHRSARTKAPETATTFNCPNCGGVFEASQDQTCSYCGQDVDHGRYDWQVASISLVHREDRSPKLTGHAPERGTNLPTITGPNATNAWAQVTGADPTVTMERLGERLVVIYTELNKSWSNLDLRPARPFVSDNLFNYLDYWTTSYRSQGLRNLHKSATITSWVIANVTRDVYYDAVTVRLWATGLDYTVDKNNKVVGGDSKVRREYSEYWTLIRGASVRGAAPPYRQCPKCGAELKINMGGNCEFCSAHLTSGEFDWVLSKIEQDEAYHG